VRFGYRVQITEVQAADSWSRKDINPKLKFKTQKNFFFLILTADPEISITLCLACDFESHYKDEVLFNRR